MFHKVKLKSRLLTTDIYQNRQRSVLLTCHKQNLEFPSLEINGNLNSTFNVHPILIFHSLTKIFSLLLVLPNIISIINQRKLLFKKLPTYEHCQNFRRDLIIRHLNNGFFVSDLGRYAEFLIKSVIQIPSGYRTRLKRTSPYDLNARLICY